MTRLVALLMVVVLGAACAGEDPNLTESGKGKPVVSVSFPERAAPGSTQEAVLEIANPGPGDMRTVVVAFALVGPDGGSSELPIPIVAFGPASESSIGSVDPEPKAVSEDGVLFTFGPVCPDSGVYPDDCPELETDPLPRLPEGESMTITFSLRMPQKVGNAANSVQVYEGSEIDRAGGVRLETLLGR